MVQLKALRAGEGTQPTELASWSVILSLVDQWNFHRGKYHWQKKYRETDKNAECQNLVKIMS